jgi:ribosomal protein L44E
MNITCDYAKVIPTSGMITVPYCDLDKRFDTLTVINIDKDQATQVAHSARRYARNHNKRFTCKRTENTLTITRAW